MENTVKRENIFGVPVDIITQIELDEIFFEILKNSKQEQIRFLSYWEFITAVFNKEKKARLKSCALLVTTSRRLNAYINFVHKVKNIRFSQFNFIIQLLGYIEKKEGSIYILGGKKKYLEKTEYNLKMSFPRIKVIGRFYGFYKKNQENKIITAVRKSSPDLVFTGIGIKKSANWGYVHKEKLNPGITVYTSNCFQIFAGKKTYHGRIALNILSTIKYLLDVLSYVWALPALVISKIIRTKKGVINV